MDLNQLQTLPGFEPARDAAAHLAELLLLIALTYVALRVSRGLLRRAVSALLDREASEGTAQELSVIELQKRRVTIQGLGEATIRVVIVLIAFVTALSILGLEIGPSIAGLGIVGVAVGFGAQSLVKDYLAGAFILIENHYAKGDVVRIADVSGVVEDFTLRRTTLRDLDGTVHTVPNGLIGVASNLTRVWARINLDVTIAYGSDMEKVTAVIDEAGREMAEEAAWQGRVLEAAQVSRVESLGDYGVTIKVLGTVRAADRWQATGELRKRILSAFREHGIEIPRPQRVIVGMPPGPAGPDGVPTDEDLAAGAD